MIESPFSLSGKTILITGASSGIGKSIAIACADAGASIFAFGRDQERLADTLSKLVCNSDNQNHRSFAVELTDDDSISEIMKSLEEEGVRFSGFVHSAGISTTLPLRSMKPDSTTPFMKLNVDAGIHLTKWITRKKMVAENGSSVVFLSSVMSVVGESGKTIYSMTKGALLSASRSLAVELAPKKVRVNCISPGVVETPMSGKAVYSRNEVALKYVQDLHPLGLGKPEDVAYSCVYLLSDAAKWVTGTNMIVDGGYTAR
ncbi:MAG: SDR family oxidoreductase [Balneolales bacterium]|nr:SDR family oxidoreductase [Balneolales bacterium]